MRRLASTVFEPICGVSRIFVEISQVLFRDGRPIRFILEDVECRCGESAGGQGIVERRFINQGAAGRVDQQGPRIQQFQTFVVDEMPGGCGRRGMQSHSVGLAESGGEVVGIFGGAGRGEKVAPTGGLRGVENRRRAVNRQR